MTLRYLPTALILTLAVAVTYSSTFLRLARGSFDVAEAHILFVAAIAVYMVWLKRGDLSGLKPSLSLSSEIGGGALTLLGCLVLLAGKLTGTTLFQDVALVVTLLGLVLLVLGREHLKVLWMPVVYLIFMFPLSDEILSPLSIYFQLATARIASVLLGLTPMDVMLEGTLLYLPHIKLEVARACNGINHIVALTILAIPLAFLHQPTLLRKGALVLSAFFIGLFANGVRVAVMGVYSAFTDGRNVHGPKDIFYVFTVFVVGVVLLLFVDAILSRRAGTRSGKSRKTVDLEAAGADRRTPRLLRPTVVSVAILFSANCYLYFLGPQPAHLKEPLSAFAPVIGDWVGQDVSGRGGVLRHVAADAGLHRIYRNTNGDQMTVEIRWFASQDESKKVVSYLTYFLHEQAEDFLVSSGGETIKIKATRVMVDGMPRVTYFWYDLHGAIVSDRYEGKWTTARDAFLARRTDGAIIVVMVKSRSGAAESASGAEFVKDFLPSTRSFLAAG